ncbi:transporter [Amphritea sp. 1_MG-2023]|uniref:transporter n=1 Tax=Amphritea sp. 1_MG-2023 TaxID=3062670 RepID=UPI0026E3850B|nr:transporter [Amphritea sp. 1_MG-2023]MDO6562059.1 transporter [Amphritea sp. 1_MG-2023]
MKNNNYKALSVSALLCGSLLSSQAFAVAETVHPRDYIPAPKGVNLSVTYLQSVSGDDFNVGGDTVSNDADLRVNAVIQRFIHYTELFGMPADPQIIIPVVDQDVGIQGEQSSGIGDIFVGSTFWPIADNENKEWFGITPFVYLPTGEYESDKAVNVGANRWSFVLQAGYTKGLTDDGLYMDLIGEVEIYGDNNDLAAGDTLSRDNMYRMSAMLSQDVTQGGYVWGRYSKQIGGEIEVDGVAQVASDVDTGTLTLGYTQWIGKRFQLQGEYSKDLHVDNGIETDGVTLRVAIPF